TPALAASAEGEIWLVRPLLDVSKARLIATLKSARIAFADDPSNRNPSFTRVRLRELMPALAREGFDSPRLAQLTPRLAPANAPIELAVDAAFVDLLQHPMPAPPPIPLAFDVEGYKRLPAEVALRLLGRAITRIGSEGPVELAKLETLHSSIEE